MLQLRVAVIWARVYADIMTEGYLNPIAVGPRGFHVRVNGTVCKWNTVPFCIIVHALGEAEIDFDSISALHGCTREREKEI